MLYLSIVVVVVVFVVSLNARRQQKNEFKWKELASHGVKEPKQNNNQTEFQTQHPSPLNAAFLAPTIATASSAPIWFMCENKSFFFALFAFLNTFTKVFFHAVHFLSNKTKQNVNTKTIFIYFWTHSDSFLCSTRKEKIGKFIETIINKWVFRVAVREQTEMIYYVLCKLNGQIVKSNVCINYNDINALENNLMHIVKFTSSRGYDSWRNVCFALRNSSASSLQSRWNIGH